MLVCRRFGMLVSVSKIWNASFGVKDFECCSVAKIVNASFGSKILNASFSVKDFEC